MMCNHQQPRSSPISAPSPMPANIPVKWLVIQKGAVSV